MHNNRIVTTRQEVGEIPLTSPVLVIDVETTGLDRFADEVIGLVVCDGINAWYANTEESIAAFIARLNQWADEAQPPAKRKLVGHNVVFDMHFLDRVGLHLHQFVWWDTMQMAHLWEDNLAESHSNLLSLKSLAHYLLGMDMKSWEEGFKGQGTERQAEYAFRDGEATWRLYAFLSERLDKDGLLPYYERMGAPLLPVVFAMEKRGLHVDVDALKTLEEKYSQMAEAAKWEAISVCEGSINPLSTKQLGEWLVKQGVALPMTGKGNYQVDEKVLTEVAGRTNPRWRKASAMASAVLGWRKARKLISTYINGGKGGHGLLQVADKDGYVHPRWNFVGTVTGRFSCANPNLQNIPAHTNGKDIRNVFSAAPGTKLVVADMSQAEVRMLAAMSKDPALQKAVQAEDIHSEVARTMFGGVWEKASAEERKEMRFRAKTIVFGIIYGRGAKAIAEEFGISTEEAQNLIDGFFARFPDVAKWRQDTMAKAVQRGFVTMLLGRRRRPILLRHPPQHPALRKLYNALYAAEMRKTTALNRGDDHRSRGKRQAVNAVIQGSVAEIIARAMVGLHDLGFTPSAQVHDEIILQVEDDEEMVASAVHYLRYYLSPVINGVQFVADIHVTDKWGEAK